MKACFAGGCFRRMAKPYDTLPGVLAVESGYCGGSEADAAYEQVKKQETEHRETVRVESGRTAVKKEDRVKYNACIC